MYIQFFKPFFFMGKKWVEGGDLSWYLLLECDHNGILPVGP